MSGRGTCRLLMKTMEIIKYAIYHAGCAWLGASIRMPFRREPAREGKARPDSTREISSKQEFGTGEFVR